MINTLKDISKGCGKNYYGLGIAPEKCGDFGTEKRLLCEVCQALLTQTEEMLNEQKAKVEKLKEKFNGASAYSSWFINQEILKIFSQEADLQEKK